MSLRVLSFNIHKGNGWWVSRSIMRRIHRQIGLVIPDILFLQEILGTQFTQLSEGNSSHKCYGMNVVYPKGNHGNAILSKYPILFSENVDLTMNKFEKRGMLHAVIKLPDRKFHTHLLCVHLGLFIKDRKKQLAEIARFIEKNISQNESIILGGDFNDWSNIASELLIGKLKFQEAFHNHHQAHAKTFPAWAPMLRLDRMYFRGFNSINAIRHTSKAW